MNLRNCAALPIKASTKQRQRERLAMDHFRPRALARALAACSMLSLLGTGAAHAQALPTGATVTSGQANIITNGNRMTVTNSNGAVIDWRSFSIGAGQAVRFDQANASSQVLNRVVGNDPSSILGSLSSNGKVWLLNPNGVLFGHGARVDVAGLVASTLSLSNSDWLAGRYQLSAVAGAESATVNNQGELRTPLGGRIVLLGGKVQNEGLIEAPGGQIVLAAGSSVDLVDTGAPNLTLRVTADKGEVLNLGSVNAPGGRIDIQSAVVNQHGIVRAESLTSDAQGRPVLAGAADATGALRGTTSNAASAVTTDGGADTAAAAGATAQAGEVVLKASQTLELGAGSVTSAAGEVGGQVTIDGGSGVTWVRGSVTATAASGQGGQIKLLGRQVGLADGALVDASGAQGGGQILVGGGQEGKDPSVPNAEAVYVAPGAVLKADATAAGDGGRLIVWSDQSTRAYGDFSARGGVAGGNGGFIETSGGWLDAQPVKADASAPLGAAGMWLLDPYDITIDGGSDSNITSGPSFSPAGSGARISPATIVAALNAGSSVTISTAAAGGGEVGNITINDATISSNSNVPRTLSLIADGSITVTGSTISGTGSPLSILLRATSGGISFPNSTLSTVGGNIDLTASGGSFARLAGSQGTTNAIIGTNGRVLIYGSQPSEVVISNVNFPLSFIQYNARVGDAPAPGAQGNGILYSLLPTPIILNPTNSLISRAYNGDTSTGALTTGQYAASGMQVGDRLSSVIGQFSDKDVAANKPILVSSADVVVRDASNRLVYGYQFASRLTGSIVPRLLGVNSLQVQAREYDGSRDASVSGRLTNLVGSENTTPSFTGTFADKNVGVGKSVAITVALVDGVGGFLARNYSVPTSLTATGTIAPATLTVTASNASKSFGSSLTFSGNEFTSVGLRAGETIGRVSLSSAGATATASVAGGPYSIIPSNATGGTFDPRNYAISYVNGTLTVTPVNLQAVLANIVGNPTKTYDGTNLAPLTPANYSLIGFFGSDAATITKTTGQYDSVNAGARSITTNLARTDFAAVGATDLRNYVLPTTATGAGTIVPKTLIPVNLTAANKVYDGTTAAGNITVQRFDGLVGNESPIPLLTGRFDSKDVGVAKPVTVQLAFGPPVNGFLASNYTIPAAALVTRADVTPAPLSIVANDASKTFGTTLSFNGTEFTSRGLVAGEQVGRVTLSSPGATATASVAGGPYSITPSNATGGSFDPRNYAISYVDGRLTVGRAELTSVLASIVGNPSKTYDGNASASLTPGNFRLTGFVAGDDAAVTKTTGQYDSKNAGSRTVTTTLGNGDFAALGTTDLGNYLLPTTAIGAGTILPKTLTPVNLTAANKVYDGSTSAGNISYTRFEGLVGSETLGASFAGLFDTKDVGTAKPVTVRFENGAFGNGFLASNYTIPASALVTRADITPAPLSIVANDASKTFGSTLSFAGSEFSTSGLVAGEQVGRVTLTSLGAAATASVAGGPYPITPSNATGGSFDPRNYNIRYIDGRLTVNRAELSAVLASIVGNPTKAYDGNDTATLAPGNFSLTGFAAGDAAAVTQTAGRYDSVNAGSRTVTASLGTADFAATGTTDLGNYLLPTTATGPGTIVPKTLVPVNLTAASKAYDGGTTAANITYDRFDGLVGNESLVASFIGRFDTKDVGTAKPVAVQLANAAQSNGFLASNYNIPDSALVTRADITPAPLSIVANDASKSFGNTLSFTGTEFTSRGLVAGEQVGRVTLTSPGASATASVAGGPYPITPSNATGGSFDPRNYAVSYVDGRLAVNRAELSAVLADIVGNPTKTYDGNDTAALAPGNFRLSGFVSGDAAAVTQTTGRYDSTDAGSRTVTATLSLADYAAAGSTDLNNYQLPTTATGAGTIVPKTLTLAGLRAVDKVYDGSDAALLASTGSLVGLVSGETLGLASGGARFDTKDAGTGKTVSIDGLSLSDGSGRAANYVLPATATTTASITPASVTVVALDASKTYGSSLSFNGSEFRTSAMVGSDQVGSVTLASAGASASASVAGGPYPVAPSAATGGSFDPRNYRFDYVDGKLTVTPAQLSATAGSVVGNPTKTYDGSNAAVLAPSQFAVNGFVAGQGATITETQGRYDSANAGARTVTVTLDPNDFAPLAGTDLRNYVLPVSAAGAGAILPKPVTVVGAVADSKTYDGTTTATINRPGTLDGLVPGQTLALTPGTARFEDKDVGTSKRVIISGLEISDGTGLASNYRLASPTASTSADIRPATLVYTASSATSVSGGALPPLSGTVGGFVAGETVTTATTGTLAFNTTATTSSPSGAFPINGGGLAAVNYVFSQAPANATALTLSPPPAAVSQGTSVVLAATAQQIALPVAPTSSTEGRTLDAVQAVPAGASSDKGLSFRSVSIGDMSQDALAALLASRDQFKKSLFAASLSKLEQDPTLADVRDCKDTKQLEQGTCLITEAIKAELADARRLQEMAKAPMTAEAQAAPGAGPRTSAAAAKTASEPTAAAVAAITEKLLQGVSAADRRAAAAAAKRRVVKAALPQIARKLALVIGVDSYADKRIPQLDNAVKDAQAVAKLLETSLGYEAIVIPNASKEAIVAALNKLAAEVDSDDSVIVYYAGHGAVVESTGLGYWQPANATADKPETWLSNADITKLIGQIGASQVALVSDSCYSGSLVTSQRIRATTATSPQQFLSQKSVVIMSSGGNEPVFDSGRGGHSPFAWNLMRALENVSSWQAGGNLFERVRFAVARELPQRPQYGAVTEAGHQVGGDYLFEQRELRVLDE